MLIGGTNSNPAGINLTTTELGRIFTSSTGTVTIGDQYQTGNITLSTATLATTAGATSFIMQSSSGAGQVILDDNSGAATALNANSGSVSIIAGTGGIVEAVTDTTGVADIGGSATSVSLTSGGAIGTSGQPLQLGATVLTTNTSANDSIQYLSALTTITATSLTAGTGTIDLESGTLSIYGMITGNFANSGTLSLAAGYQLTVTGNFTQSAAGTFSDMIGGTSSSLANFGQLVVDGTASLNGTLDVTVSGYVFTGADDYKIITYASETGTFSSTSLSGLSIEYNAMSVDLSGEPIVVVMNTNVTGAGSLYAAITAANLDASAEIVFNIPASQIDVATSTFVITPTISAPLPIISTSVTIEGSTEATFLAGSSPPVVLNTPAIVLDGTNAGAARLACISRDRTCWFRVWILKTSASTALTSAAPCTSASRAITSASTTPALPRPATRPASSSLAGPRTTLWAAAPPGKAISSPATSNPAFSSSKAA